MKIPHRFTQSLRFKLVASSVLIQIVFVTLLVAHTINLVEDNLIKQSETRLLELDRLFNASLNAPMVQQDIETLQEILDESVRKDGLNYFVLFDRGGQLIAKAGEAAEYKNNVSIHESLASSIHSGKDILHSHVNINVVGIQYGQLHYGISIKSLVQIKSALIQDSLLIAIIGIIFSGLALFLTGMWLTRYLTNLAEVSQEFAAGNLCARVNDKSNDEIGYLAEAFNYMAESLDTRIKDLNDSQKAQNELLVISQQEKARLTSLLEVMTRGILFETLDEKIAYYNPAFVKMWDLHASSNVIGRAVFEVQENIKAILKTEVAKNALLSKNDAVDGGKGVEFELINGAMVIQRNYPVFDDEKNILGTLWIYEDVTVERQTAEQLSMIF